MYNDAVVHDLKDKYYFYQFNNLPCCSDFCHQHILTNIDMTPFKVKQLCAWQVDSHEALDEMVNVRMINVNNNYH